MGDGSIVVWGDPCRGGAMGDLGRSLGGGVHAVCASGGAFAALLVGGEVVAWGDPDCGGDAGSAAEQLVSGVVTLTSTWGTFTAAMDDETDVTWGGVTPSASKKRLACGIEVVHHT